MLQTGRDLTAGGLCTHSTSSNLGCLACGSAAPQRIVGTRGRPDKSAGEVNNDCPGEVRQRKPESPCQGPHRNSPPVAGATLYSNIQVH